MKSHLLPAATLILLVGCATAPPPPQAPAATAEAQQTVCTQEYHVGSMLPKSRCGPPVSEADRQQAIDTLRKQIPPGGNKATGAGG
jgi:hypothetical protein